MNPEYIIQGERSGDGAFAYLLLVPCSQPPIKWEDTVANCDLDKVRAVRIDPLTLLDYSTGDVYPPVATPPTTMQ